MALRLDPTTLTGAKLRGGVARALDEAAASLTDRPEGIHTAVHETRKTLKRLRALYRLVAHGSPALLERENARLRDAAGHLSEGREAAALAETANWLAGQGRTADETALLARMARALEVRRDAIDPKDIERQVTLATTDIRSAIDGVTELSLPESRRKTAKLIANGWRRALRKGRRILSPLTVDSQAEAFHDLRKVTQTLDAYHGLLKPLWPEAMAARQDRLRNLIDTLGRENDLAGLTGLMAREPRHFGEAIEQVILQRILAKRRQALRLAALQQAAKIYAGDPQDDANRVEILWKGLSG